jgi:hypothetical protein
MKYFLRFAILLAGIMLLSWGCERKTTNEITNLVSPEVSSYVGSEACQSCHQSIYDSFRKTGHPYKLSDAADAQQPGYYPFSTVEVSPTIPGGWSNVSMVIGGFWWKARFIDNDGRIYTGPQRQYNLATGEFVKYETDTLGLKNYTCGGCHTTGYKAVGNQNGKPGLIGTWALNGVQCEACHGPGGSHVENPYDVNMTIDRSSEMCGECHHRGDVFKIPAKGGFVKHHEQWNEMFTTKHSALQCVTCHDPHVGLHPLNPDRASAIRIQCENCHFKQAEGYANSTILHAQASVTCTNCHMPYSAKSAIGDLATFTGDIHSHLWRINPDTTAQMFTPDQKYANGYITLDYSCKPCHPSKSLTELFQAVPNIH